MKKLTIIIFLLLAVFGKHALAQTKSDSAKVVECSLNYIEGWFAGDTERMEKALHPDLVKRRVEHLPQTGDPILDNLTKTSMMTFTKAGFGKATPKDKIKIEVIILDIYGNIASAKVISAEYIDYLQLVKWNGEWKILNVLWDVKTK